MTSDPVRIGIDSVPIVDARTAVRHGFYCIPHRSNAEGNVVRGDPLLTEGEGKRKINTAVLARNVCLTVRTTVDHMRRAGDEEGVFVIPINGKALSFKDIASDFTAECKGIEKELIERIIFEVVNVDDSVTMSYLDDIAIILYSYCHIYIAKVSLNVSHLSFFATCNYAGISLDLMGKAWPADKVGAYFQQFQERAETNRLLTYVHGIGTPEIAEASRAAGINFIDGKAV